MGRSTSVTIIGTRPQFIKAASINFDEDKVDNFLVHTGQHYDYGLSRQFWKLRKKEPDQVLNCASHDPTIQMKLMLDQIAPILIHRKPDYVIVVGDCNSTLGGALTAELLKIPVIHIEAGLRSFDWTMPEERNRYLTDHLAQVNFCVTAENKRQIERETHFPRPMMQQWYGSPPNHNYVVGDTLYDSMMSFIGETVPMLGDYFLATVHREANANEHIEEILDALNSLEQRVIFPKHPRIKLEKEYKNIEILKPVDYVTMLSLQLGADMIFTDSGGVGREAVWLGKRCVMLRENTEFPEFVHSGHVVLAGHSKEAIVDAQFAHWPSEPCDHGQDGHAGQRIAEVIYGL